MKQTQMPVFLITHEEIDNLFKGFPVGVTPTNGMGRFLIALDRVPAPTNGRPDDDKDKGYTVHRRAPGKGRGRFECKCGTTAKTLSRLFKHQKKAHA